MRIGIPSEFFEDSTVVDADRVRSFAAATLQDDIDHVSAGIAPALFGLAVLAGPAAERLLRHFFDDRIPTVIQVAQELECHRPLHIGDPVRVRARIREMVDYGLAPALVVEVTVRSDRHPPQDPPAITATSTVLLPDEPRIRRVTPRPARPGKLEQITEYAVWLPAELPIHYAAVSGDNNPVHLDASAARAAGLPGIVLHGMATLAVVWAATERALTAATPPYPRRPARFIGAGVRFTRPVLPGAELRVTPYRTSDPRVVGVSVEQAGRSVFRDAHFTLQPLAD